MKHLVFLKTEHFFFSEWTHFRAMEFLKEFSENEKLLALICESNILLILFFYFLWNISVHAARVYWIARKKKSIFDWSGSFAAPFIAIKHAKLAQRCFPLHIKRIGKQFCDVDLFVAAAAAATAEAANALCPIFQNKSHQQLVYTLYSVHIVC